MMKRVMMRCLSQKFVIGFCARAELPPTKRRFGFNLRHNNNKTTMAAAPRSLLGLALATRALVTTSFTPMARIMSGSSFTPMQSVANDKANNEQQAVDALPSFYGGDFCGLSATFSATTGELIPVPEYLVPDVLLEWGQGPSCLEVIVSEDIHDGSLTRQTVTVVPDVGCGVDNLDTIKSQQVIGNLGKMFGDDDSIVALDYYLPNQATRSETTFGLQNGQRMRVMVDSTPIVQDDHHEIKSPITLVLERQTSKKSSGGTIADGGGLDGRTVMGLLGDLAKGKPFAEDKPVTWVLQDDKDETHLVLPGNLTVSYSSSPEEPSVLEVGHVMGDETTRRVVRRCFSFNGPASIEYDYSTETKT